jgi:hypothetical protein
LAKAKTKAAVKSKPAKAPARTTVRTMKAPKKAVAVKLVKTSAAKPVKAIVAKAADAVVAAKTGAKTATNPPVIATPRKTQPLTLPVAKATEVLTAKPLPVVRKAAAVPSTRADMPPADGFTLLVDGHFKNQYDDLKGAKAVASELKSRFPMLRVEIYDASKKTRLPA